MEHKTKYTAKLPPPTLCRGRCWPGTVAAGLKKSNHLSLSSRTRERRRSAPPKAARALAPKPTTRTHTARQNLCSRPKTCRPTHHPKSGKTHQHMPAECPAKGLSNQGLRHTPEGPSTHQSAGTWPEQHQERAIQGSHGSQGLPTTSVLPFFSFFLSVNKIVCQQLSTPVEADTTPASHVTLKPA